MAVRDCIGGGAIKLLLTLLRLKLLLLLRIPLPMKDLLSLDGRQEIMSLQIFRIVRAHALFLHLLEFLKKMSDGAHCDC